MAAGIPSGVYGHPTHVSRETASMVPWVFLRVLTAPVSLRLSAGMKRAPPYECVAAPSADVYGDPCVQSTKGDVGEEGSGPEARKRSGHAAGPASWEVRREWASHAPLVAWTRRTYGGRQPRTRPFHVKHRRSCSKRPPSGRNFQWCPAPQLSGDGAHRAPLRHRTSLPAIRVERGPERSGCFT